MLEICVEDVPGLRAAADHGADRVELCAALALGGLTPPLSLMQAAAALPIATRVLCRPRPGNFSHDAQELQLIAEDMTATADAGLDGVVIGAGSAAGLDTAALAQLVDHARALGARRARPLGLTLHRVFDALDDQAAGLEQAIELGFDTVLTSGGAPRAGAGAEQLGALVRQAAGRITILAGSGIDVDAVPRLAAEGVTAFHASCRAPQEWQPEHRLQMLGFETEAPLRTDPARVKSLKTAISLANGNTNV